MVTASVNQPKLSQVVLRIVKLQFVMATESVIQVKTLSLVRQIVKRVPVMKMVFAKLERQVRLVLKIVLQSLVTGTEFVRPGKQEITVPPIVQE